MKVVLAYLHYKNLLRWRDTKLSDPLLVISEKLSANFVQEHLLSQFLLSGSLFGQFSRRELCIIKKKYVLPLILDLKNIYFLNSVSPEFKRIHTKNATIFQGRFKDHI